MCEESVFNMLAALKPGRAFYPRGNYDMFVQYGVRNMHIYLVLMGTKGGAANEVAKNN